MMPNRPGWQLRWYRRALALSSAEFRSRFAEEAVSSLDLALAAERARRGRIAAFWLWLRAMGDAVRMVALGRGLERDRGGRCRAPRASIRCW